MKTVALLIFNEVVPSSITGVIDLLTGANKYMERAGRPMAFCIEMVSQSTDAPYITFPGQGIGHKTFQHAGHPDLVIVPSFSVGDMESVIVQNRAAVNWLKEMNATGSEIASLCVGSYFLAEAGLLDGKEVTSHWAAADDIQKRYPGIKMKSDLVITDQDGIYTSGGAFSSLKLVLYLVEKFCDRETALWISKMYAIEMDRTSQAHFAVFMGQHRHDDKEILKAQEYIEQNYQTEITMDDVSSLINMGQRNFIRRFKAATNNTPFEYLQRVRIESAKKAIEMNHKDLPFIMEDTGYTDLKAFRTIFKRITGLSPMEYKKKYARI
jgi:transcriptional regulator GlxA family with amidase domain